MRAVVEARQGPVAEWRCQDGLPVLRCEYLRHPAEAGWLQQQQLLLGEVPVPAVPAEERLHSAVHLAVTNSETVLGCRESSSAESPPPIRTLTTSGSEVNGLWPLRGGN